ncbi:MFS transporter [Sulfodiicoccus acidiphilus]|uniref:MFS transporter n=1 Tax=Sulfodiicoccus acidiphilus TaxID=1670455 RepID=A0A348B227_9CREN|nr:MFS transporter [Sulfodiicoccus acidiphilus]GGU02859.1 MFS transporter [Sulfodiicoccus acidiphilus]
MLTSLSVLTMYVEMVVLPSLYHIETQFDVSSSEAAWVLSAETLGGLLVSPVIGKTADAYGKKRTLLSILAIYTASVIFTSISPSFAFLVAFRAIQGVGLAVNPIAYTILRENLDKRELPIAQGIIASTFAVGAAVALPIGSFISQYYSWQFAYQTAIPILLTMSWLIFRYIPESKVRVKEPTDYLGILLLGGAFLSAGISLTEASSWGWLSLNTLTGFLLSALFLVAFVKREKSTDTPFIELSELSNPNVAVPLVASFVSGFGLFLMFQSIIYLFELPKPEGFGMDIISTGITLAPVSLIMLVVGPLFGRLSLRVGIRPILLLTPLVAALGSLLLGIESLSYSLTTYDVVVLMFLSMVGIGGMTISRITLLMVSTSEKRLATITGTNTSMRLMGNTLGPVLASSLMDTFKVPIYEGMVRGVPLFVFLPGREAFFLIFATSAISSLITAAISTRIKEVYKRSELQRDGPRTVNESSVYTRVRES